MSEIIYAQKARISDDRLKDATVAEATFTEKTYLESPVYAVKDQGAQIADRKADLYEALQAGKITQEKYDESLAQLVELKSDEYAQEAVEAENLRDNGATADKQAAGEIIKVISDDKEAIKEKAERKEKVYFASYFDLFVASFRVILLKRDPSVDKLTEKELDRRKAKASSVLDNAATKYSKTVSFADNLLKINNDPASKKLASPVQKDPAFVYEGK